MKAEKDATEAASRGCRFRKLVCLFRIVLRFWIIVWVVVFRLRYNTDYETA